MRDTLFDVLLAYFLQLFLKISFKVPERRQKVYQKRPNDSKAPKKGLHKTRWPSFLDYFDVSSTIFLFYIVLASIWLLLPPILVPIASSWLLLPPIVSYCLFAAPIVSYWLLMAPIAPLVSYWLLLVPIRSYWLLLALYFSNKNKKTLPVHLLRQVSIVFPKISWISRVRAFNLWQPVAPTWAPTRKNVGSLNPSKEQGARLDLCSLAWFAWISSISYGFHRF